MNLFETVCLTTYFALVKFLAKIKHGLVYFGWPITKHLCYWELKKYGIHMVRKPKSSLDLIIPENYSECEIVSKMSENPFDVGMDMVVDGKLKIQDVTQFVFDLLRKETNVFKSVALWDPISWPLSKFNMQCNGRAWDVCRHYDLGLEIFQSFLDSNLQYSCGYWKTARNLEQAQLDKLELIAQKLKLKPGMTVLDIGCGWGTLAKYLAKNHQVSVVGVTIAKDQIAFGEKLCKGLPVQFKYCDYQKMPLDVKYDRVVSIAFFEHAGPKNYKTLFSIVNQVLKDETSLFVMQTMGRNGTKFPGNILWFHKNIMPNWWFPKFEDVIMKSEDLLVVEDVHNFGPDYALTIKAWEDNFEKNWDLMGLGDRYDDRFRRMWKLYLQMGRGLLASRTVQLYQFVFSKNGLVESYRAPR